MWDFLPAELLTTPWTEQDADMTLRTGARVRLTRSGTVAFVRSGFAQVRWDDGLPSSVWAADLKAA